MSTACIPVTSPAYCIDGNPCPRVRRGLPDGMVQWRASPDGFSWADGRASRKLLHSENGLASTTDSLPGINSQPRHGWKPLLACTARTSRRFSGVHHLTVFLESRSSKSPKPLHPEHGTASTTHRLTDGNPYLRVSARTTRRDGSPACHHPTGLLQQTVGRAENRYIERVASHQPTASSAPTSNHPTDGNPTPRRLFFDCR